MSTPTPQDDDRFLDEAVTRGELSPEQAADCRRIRAALTEVRMDLDVDEVAVRKGFLTRSAADEVKRALARRRIGRYEVLERLGRGGSAVVFRARDTRLDRIVALKVVTRPADLSPEDAERFLERFRREARIAVTLNHENVVRGLDFGEADGYVYFAMEFVAGESLATRLERDGRLAADEAMALAREIVRALAHVHAFGLVHRDVKPGNVLVTPGGEVKLCDLGLARPEAFAVARDADAGRLAGTPLYVAPEQIRDPRGVDWRADVYGLGATLYHLLTARPPFAPQPGVSVLHRHLDEAPADPREHVVDLSPSVAAVVLKMLAKQPADRYATLDDLTDDLDAVLDGRPPLHALRLEGSAPSAVDELLGHRETRVARVPVDEPPGGLRLGLIPTGAAVATVLATALLIVFAANRPLDRSDAPQPPQVAENAPRATEPPVEPASRPPRVRDPGREALALARELAVDPDTDVFDVIEQFEHVADTFAEHASGRDARAWLDAKQAEFEARAEAELARRGARADALAAEWRFAEAIEVYSEFPRELGRTAAATKLRDARERLHDAARARAAQLESDAEAAVRTSDFDAADALVAEIRAMKLPETAVVADRAQQRVLGARSRYAAARDEQAAAYHETIGSVVLLVRDESWQAARRRVAVVRGGDVLTAYAPDLEQFEVDLARASAVGELVLRRWAELTASGATIELRLRGRAPNRVTSRAAGVLRGELLLGAGGESVGVVRMHELTLVSLGRIVGAPFDDADADERRARLLFLLAERNLPAADELLALLDLAGREDSAAHVAASAVRSALRSRADARVAELAGSLSERTAEAVLTAVEQALAEWPDHGPALTLRGRALEIQGARDAAEEAYEQAAAAVPADPTALLLLGRLRLQRERLDAAEAALRDLLSRVEAGSLRDEATATLVVVEAARRERRVEVLRREARRALRRKDSEEATPLLEQIVALVPDDAEALLALGELHVEARRYFNAFVALRTLVLAHPADPRVDAAEQLLADPIRRFRNISSEDRTRLHAAEASLHALDLADALTAYDDALRVAPFFREARLGRARALLLRFDTEGIAEDVALAAAEIHLAELLGPGRHETRMVRIEVRLAQGRVGEALVDARIAIEERPADAEPLLLLGRALLDADRPDEALAAFEAAYERKQFAEPLYWQARAFARQGRLAAARATLAAMTANHLIPRTLVAKIEALQEIVADRNQ